ncbi:MAG: c-type cytochrome [Terracidiphilus sp.]|jgi:mono/diheme cytochrome c family protein
MKHLASGILAIALSATVSFAAASSARWQQVPSRDHAQANPLAAQPEAIAAGALVYREHCQQCHKANAQGDGRKRPALRSERIRTASDGDIEWFLRQGDLVHGMPSWSSLPQSQRWQIVTYLKSIQ